MTNYQLKKQSHSAKNKKYKLSNDFFKFEKKYNLNFFLKSKKKINGFLGIKIRFISMGLKAINFF